MKLLEGKVAVITGGSSGIGRATSRLFAEHGAHIVIADRQREPREGGTPTDELVASEHDVQTRFVQTDVTVAADREAALDAAQELGGLDILLNNAGVFRQEDVLEVTEADYDQMMGVNVKAVFFMAQAAARRMVAAGGGNIIMLSSIAGIQGNGTAAVYAGTKGAVRLLAYALADALGPRGVRVNAIHPGVIETSMTRIDTTIATDERGREYEQRIASRRLGQPQDIARAALFLASDLSEYVNGSSLFVDGGLMRV
jgi:NAD(P)-dependent dehydrogenase (short-subunit alcohol dehydrogenase family)